LIDSKTARNLVVDTYFKNPAENALSKEIDKKQQMGRW
jgi:hypothetical protein